MSGSPGTVDNVFVWNLPTPRTTVPYSRLYYCNSIIKRNSPCSCYAYVETVKCVQIYVLNGSMSMLIDKYYCSRFISYMYVFINYSSRNVVIE